MIAITNRVIHLNLTRSQISLWAKIYDGHWSQIRKDHCQKEFYSSCESFLLCWMALWITKKCDVMWCFTHINYQTSMCMNSLTQLELTLVIKIKHKNISEQRAVSEWDFTWKQRESDYRSVTISENVIIIKTDGASQRACDVE